MARTSDQAMAMTRSALAAAQHQSIPTRKRSITCLTTAHRKGGKQMYRYSAAIQQQTWTYTCITALCRYKLRHITHSNVARSCVPQRCVYIRRKAQWQSLCNPCIWLPTRTQTVLLRPKAGKQEEKRLNIRIPVCSFTDSTDIRLYPVRALIDHLCP